MGWVQYMNIFFSSDFHLGHFNIIEYCNRPFLTLNDMDSFIIGNCNARVKEDDLLIHNGDFCFKYSSEAPDSKKNAFEYYRNQLNCKNIIFLKGNHDGNRNGTKTIIDGMSISHGGERIWITHNPAHARPDFKINLVGHVHNNWKIKSLNDYSTMVNIGVDVWHFEPLTINEILYEYNTWKIKKESP